MREVVVKGGDVATDDKCGAEECEAGVWDGERGLNAKQVFKREVE